VGITSLGLRLAGFRKTVGICDSANQALYAQKGIEDAGSKGQVCFRLWWRNKPERFYLDGARMIGEATGLDNAIDLMTPIMKPYNNPTEVLPILFEKLDKKIPIMFKSTPMDIHDNAPLTEEAGKYPKDIEQIIEISYENYHLKPWPWCKARHIRIGLDAIKDHSLTGYVSLPINMGNNSRDMNPEIGNLGRMNTWMFDKIANGDKRSDRELLAAWLEQEFEGPQPDIAVDTILEAEEIADMGVQWGGGIRARNAFSSPHTTKLTWFSEGFAAQGFTDKMADPDREFIESHITMKHEACERAYNNLARIRAAEAAMHPDLYKELEQGYSVFADVVLLQRDWNSYLLMLYAVEKKVYSPERKILGRMSRYAETFISNLVRLRETPAGKRVMSSISFPDDFPLS